MFFAAEGAGGARAGQQPAGLLGVLARELECFHHHEFDIRDRQETLSMMPTNQLAQDYDTFEQGFLHGGCFKAARHGKMPVQRAGKDPCMHQPCYSAIPRSKHQ